MSSPRVQFGSNAHKLLGAACRALEAHDPDAALQRCQKLYARLPDTLRRLSSAETVLSIADDAVRGGALGACCNQKTHYCLCCTLDDVLLNAGLDTTAHGCAHEHVPRPRDGYVEKPKPQPQEMAPPRYPDSDDSRLSSRSVSPTPGRVTRSVTRARSAASPYARPAAPRHARARPSPAVDALADKMASLSPFGNANNDVARLADLLAHYTLADADPAPRMSEFALGAGAARVPIYTEPAFLLLPPYPRTRGRAPWPSTLAEAAAYYD